MRNPYEPPRSARSAAAPLGAGALNERGENVDNLWSIKRFARWRYELPDGAEPTKGQLNTVTKMCREGTVPAVKVGTQWRIDTRKILEGARR